MQSPRKLREDEDKQMNWRRVLDEVKIEYYWLQFQANHWHVVENIHRTMKTLGNNIFVWTQNDDLLSLY